MDTIKNIELTKIFPFLEPHLIEEIQAHASLIQVNKETEILRVGQYVKMIPVVLKGLVKVFTKHQDKELLLYYIKSNESCIMSFTASLNNDPSNVFAITEEDTTAIMLPVDKVAKWMKQFPEMNNLFYQQYNLRYTELLDTIHHVLFDKMDKRLYDYLKEKLELTEKSSIKISHKQIANELGTAREVISRVIKKLEHEGKVKQYKNTIEIIG